MDRKYLVDISDLMREWDENNIISPPKVTAGSQKKVWWKCDKGHKWEAIVKNRVNGSGCPFCSGNSVLRGYNDMAFLYPGIAKEWSDKNLPSRPQSVTANSNMIVWWKCEKGHEWKARISDRTRGHGCPICAGKLLMGYNSKKYN